jgi:glycosyltransferase involved in cell wall biosynthesis
VEAEAVTVVIPAYNEAPVIAAVVREALREIVARGAGIDILVVDDGSTDGTAAALAEVTATGADVSCLRLDRNVGQGPALYQGFEAARGDWICQMDGDGQLVPADFWELWSRRDDGDLVLGVRRTRQDPLHRRLLTRVVRGATRAAGHRRLEDAASPLRLIRRSTWEDVRGFVGDGAVALPILVSVAASRRGWRVCEVPVRHRPRLHGVSHLRRLHLLRFIVLASLELSALSVRLQQDQAVPGGPPLAEA